MDRRAEIREFLTSRRARLRPGDVGLPVYGGGRRVPGLRREELAALAGVSVSYYTRLERGDATGVSDSVLEAIARALHLDDAERTHLGELARATSGWARPARRRTTSRTLRPALQHLLDSLTDVPAIIVNPALDLIGANLLARALYSDMFERQQYPNLARYMFLIAAQNSFWPDWETTADHPVAMLRAAAALDPYDRNLTDLVGELSTRSEEFRRRWAAHDVLKDTNGILRMHHPEVGELTVTYETFQVSAEPGLTMKTFGAQPGTTSADKLRILASWQASRTQQPGTDQDPASPWEDSPGRSTGGPLLS